MPRTPRVIEIRQPDDQPALIGDLKHVGAFRPLQILPKVDWSEQSLLPALDDLTTTSKEAVTGRYSDLTAHLSGRHQPSMLGKKGAGRHFPLSARQLTLFAAVGLT